MTNWKWRDVASVKIKLKVPATQHHHHMRPAPAHWRAISNIRYLFGLVLYIDPCITNIFAEYSQQDATFHNLFISVRRSTWFRRVFRPSSGAQNCTYSARYWSDKYLTLYVQLWAPDDGRKNRLKHVQRLTEINKLWNVASCWLYSVNLSPK